MAASVIYLGCDNSYRVPVLRNAGFEVRTLQTLDELGSDLLKNGEPDAVFLSADDGPTIAHATAVIREHSPAPLILFCDPATSLDRDLYDRVYWGPLRPEEWLRDTADLIAQCRESRAEASAVKGISRQLRGEAKSAVAQSQWQRARARMEQKRNLPPGLAGWKDNSGHEK